MNKREREIDNSCLNKGPLKLVCACIYITYVYVCIHLTSLVMQCEIRLENSAKQRRGCGGGRACGYTGLVERTDLSRQGLKDQMNHKVRGHMPDPRGPHTPL